jgi:hypothetical protein
MIDMQTINENDYSVDVLRVTLLICTASAGPPVSTAVLTLFNGYVHGVDRACMHIPVIHCTALHTHHLH